MVYSSRENVIYGRSNSGDFVFAISCDSNEVISRVEVDYPVLLAYDSSNNKVYCTAGFDSLVVIDGSTHTRVKAIPLEGATWPIWDATSGRLYVSCGYENDVAVIDCATDSVLCRIPAGTDPHRLTISEDQRKLFVNNWDGEAVSIIDLEINQLIRTIPVGGIPGAGCYYAGAVQKYYCNGFFEAVVIDGEGDSIVARIPLSNSAASMVAVEAHELVMVGGTTGSWDSVFVIDTVGDSVLRAFPVGKGPNGLVWSPATDLVYAANGHSNDVSVLAGDGSGLVLWSLPVAHGPFVFVCVPRHERLYLGHINSSMVYVIKDRAGGVEEGWPVACGSQPAATFVQDVLWIPQSADRVPHTAVLLDITGRKVADLEPGENNLGRLAPGVYLAVAAGGKVTCRVLKVR